MNEINRYSADEQGRIKGAWVEAIERAKECKRDFAETAREVMDFYSKSHDHVYINEGPMGFFKGATINKTYEGVKVFGSFLHQQAPVRRVTGKEFNDPLAGVLENYLSYSARELDLRRHGRLGLDEALIKGRGLLFTEIDEHSNLVHSRYLSVDDYLVDPDSRSIDDIWWMAVRCRAPKWYFVRKYGEAARKVTTDGCESADDKTPKDSVTQEMVTYWKIFSKMGSGLRIKGAQNDNTAAPGDPLEDYKFIVIAAGADGPVYIGAWPTPYWVDVKSMGWPVSVLDFAIDPNKPWPISIFKPGLPLQKWIDWAYSFLLRKVATTSRDMIVMPNRLDDKQKAIVRNDAVRDLEIMYVDDQQLDDIKKLFQVLQFPGMNGDLLNAISMAEQKFREITGLAEILSGQSEASYRSAEEARVKDRNSRSRIEDMNQEVEVWHSHAARHEAIALRYHFGADPNYIAEILGPQDAEVWAQQANSGIRAIVREYQYNIEEGSMRRQSPEARADYSQILMEMVFPAMLQTQSYDTCNNMISEWCKARAIPTPERFFINTTVVDGRLVTPAQQEAMLAAEQQQDQATEEAIAQDAAAQEQAQAANQIQADMVAQKAQTDLLKTQMQTQSAERIQAAKSLEAMMKGGGSAANAV